MNRFSAAWAAYAAPGNRTSGIAGAHRGKPEAFFENYCSRLGTLLEAGYNGLALLAAKQKAGAAAKHANEATLDAKAADPCLRRVIVVMPSQRIVLLERRNGTAQGNSLCWLRWHVA